ncbi:hypothetical protein CLAIMM_03085 isoform 1 [Cladophialophora immunda]|nr:hypothetical protein CLAIMM_03085 isoform 1 [Cladophialophora immunda]
MATLLGRNIGPVGYGLMGLTWRPDPPTQAESFELLSTAIASGANLFNGGELYGTPERHTCHLVKEYFEAHPENASKVLLSIKGGMKYGVAEPDASEENLRRSVDECNRVLAGTKKIDIFECARVDPKVPIEDQVRVLGKLVEEGKIGGIGLSEVKADTIRRAHAVHPISVVEVELSLWTTNILNNGVADVCAELGIPIIAYAPLSRGALTSDFGDKNEDLPVHRRNFPKFQNDVLQANRRLTEEVNKIGLEKGVKSSQTNSTRPRRVKEGICRGAFPGTPRAFLWALVELDRLKEGGTWATTASLNKSSAKSRFKVGGLASRDSAGRLCSSMGSVWETQNRQCFTPSQHFERHPRPDHRPWSPA